MDSEFQLRDIIGIVKRRYLFFVIPFALLSPIAVAVAVLLPPIYQSSGLILIESPQISQAIVAGNIGSAAQERVEVIRRRVMTRANLLGIAEKYHVFTKEALKKMSSTDVVNAVRNSLSVEFISAGSRRNQATIAFKVSFDHRNPRIAARVANELVTLFMNENVRSRTQIATETTEFLNQEAEKLERQLIEIEDKIAQYKQQHSGALPENLDIQMQMRERLEEQIRRIEREIIGYEEELRFLEVEIRAAQVRARQNPQAESTVQQDDASIYSKIPGLNRYLQIRSDLFTARATKEELHPDVKALKRDLYTEAARLIAAGGLQEDAVLLAQKESELRQLEDNDDTEYSDDEKQILVTEISDLRKGIENQIADDSSPNNGKTNILRERNEDLLKLTLEDFQLRKAVANERIDSAKQRANELAKRLSEVEESIIQIPQVDRVLRNLNRDYSNAQQKYNEIRNKAMEAQIAENVEEASKSERFVLLEPPSVPDQPEKPNRRMLLAIGLSAAFSVGAAALVGIEFLDGGVRGAENLASLVNMVPLAVIPYIETVDEREKKRKRIVIAVSLLLLMGVIALVLIHYFYLPLDRIIYKIIDRFG
ncbi:MAG: hypothetical protein RIM72_10510 [Alphaproteobacteria bacterium]